MLRSENSLLELSDVVVYSRTEDFLETAFDISINNKDGTWTFLRIDIFNDQDSFMHSEINPLYQGLNTFSSTMQALLIDNNSYVTMLSLKEENITLVSVNS